MLENGKPKIFDLLEFFKVDLGSLKGKEYITKCPFCGKEGHFFINCENGLWQCFRCNEKGGYSAFLNAFFQQQKKFTTKEDIGKLALAKGLPLEAFDGFDIACDGNRYLYASKDIQGGISGLRYYFIGNKSKSIKTVPVALFNGVELLKKENDDFPVYICEGESDTIALTYLFRKIKMKAIIVGTPGTIFKNEWGKYFSGRNVYLCFDNDDAGETFTQKVTEFLRTCNVHSVYHIKWDTKFKKGFDIRDFITIALKEFKFNYDAISLVFSKLFNWIPRDPRENIFIETDNRKLSFPELLTKYAEVLDISPDIENAIKLTLATCLSINIPGIDPIWLFIVAPPGHGKTEVLKSTTKSNKHCYFQSTLRRNTLISGFRGLGKDDPSLIPKLQNKTLILKDFTEILSKNQIEKEEIVGILRGAYDGHADRDFGNGVTKHYDCRFSIVAGVTREIQAESQAAMGDRFLRYNFHYGGVDYNHQQDMSLAGSLFGDDDKTKLQYFVKAFLEKPRDWSKEHLISLMPKWFHEKIKPLARLIAHLRTPVRRYERGAKNNAPIYDPHAESGNRPVNQLQRLGLALAMLLEKEQIDEEVYDLVFRVAWDTIDSKIITIIQAIKDSPTHLTKGDIAQFSHIPMQAIYTYVDDLRMLGIIEVAEVIETNRNKINTYKLTEYIQDLWTCSNPKEYFDASVKD